jgi:hypothetical protein
MVSAVRRIFRVRHRARSRNDGVERAQQIGVWVDTHQLCGLAELVEERGDLGAASRASGAR